MGLRFCDHSSRAENEEGSQMRNDFTQHGNMMVRYQTVEERREILRILEEQCGFRIDEEEKKVTEVHQKATRTFNINVKRRTIQYGIQSFIGAAMMTHGIRFYSAQEFFRIAELEFQVMPRFPVFHVPHDGSQFPDELMSSVCVSEEEFRRYHYLMSDIGAGRFVPEAYRGGHMYVMFEISRILCDVERFIGPEEEMEQYGMGFCYEKACDGTKIKIVTDEVKTLTKNYYDKHHAWMNRLCEKHPRILLFDLHSFSEEVLPEHIRRRSDHLPDVCIGTDPKYTPGELTSRIRRRMEELNLTCMENIPYSGTFVPGSVLDGSSSCDLISVMLEFNRKLYCDENGEPVEERMEQIRKLVRRILVDCVDID